MGATAVDVTSKEESERPVRIAKPEAPSGWRAALPDVLLGAIAAVATLPTLLYPFGRDQGLYHYVAREWVLRGSVPYKDVLDHKTPGIYLLHALSVLLFGETMWGIRVLEALGVLAFGFVAGALVAPRGEAHAPGARGAGMLATVVFYFGHFDFWSTAQSEIWYAGFGMCAVLAARRIERTERAAALVGLFAGIAVLTKPPSVWFVLVAVVVLALRLRGEGRLTPKKCARELGWLVGMGALVPALVLGYFGVKGALPAMKDIVVGANSYYVKHEVGAVARLDQHLGYILWIFAPTSYVLLPGLVVGLVFGARRKIAPIIETFALGLGLVLAATLAVAMQGKFYLLHWGCLPLPLAYAAVAIAAWALTKARVWVLASVFVVVVLLGYRATEYFANAFPVQRDTLDAEIKYLQGTYDRRAFDVRFQSAAIGFFFHDSRDVGTWLEAHTTPDETVTVRGFQPEIYVVAHRRHAGRFFWTTFLTNPARAYRREEWLAEELRDFTEHPPKYVVALDFMHEGLDSAEYHEARGYTRVAAFPGYVILERAAK
ncbi:MAG: glycosyltransferase family 39 protein [Myxococcales bacterium]|nr:glycosyltransferase family 39 protein [Myxococcales bacterium]